MGCFTGGNINWGPTYKSCTDVLMGLGKTLFTFAHT